MPEHKPIATVSLDLDNQWTYMKIHGDEGWDQYPSYFDIFIPYILDVLDELNLKITFFIVGKDAVFEENRKYLAMITARGHDVGNHSYHHESWLQTYNREQLEAEVSMAEDSIYQVTGKKVYGFRGPGFSWSHELLSILAEKGYKYDASTFPTWLGPLARRYYFSTSNLPKQEREERKELFGNFNDVLRPNKPYQYALSDRKKLLEIPVTTMPVLRLPFHLSYLIFLSGISPLLMKIYFRLALALCKLTGTRPSYLLHPLDLISGDRISALGFFPGMNVPSEKKLEVFRYVMNCLKRHYQLVPMDEFAALYSKPGNQK